MRIITCKIIEQSGRKQKDPWKKYLKGNSRGSFDWMLDMGMAIAEKNIRMDWKDFTNESQRPPYMRKRFVPCIIGIRTSMIGISTSIIKCV